MSCSQNRSVSEGALYLTVPELRQERPLERRLAAWYVSLGCWFSWQQSLDLAQHANFRKMFPE
jgi:hypothetical protein